MNLIYGCNLYKFNLIEYKLSEFDLIEYKLNEFDLIECGFHDRI